jgi:CheY-like chemotaxis protein
MLNAAPLLVVDDNPEFRQLVCEALALQGYNVLSAANGELALQVLETVQPALFLVDVEMPAMSGPEFVREAQHRGALDPYRVVMISGSALRSASLGRWRLTKPLDLDLLFRVVADFCGAGQLGGVWRRETSVPALAPAPRAR